MWTLHSGHEYWCGYSYREYGRDSGENRDTETPSTTVAPATAGGDGELAKANRLLYGWMAHDKRTDDDIHADTSYKIYVTIGDYTYPSVNNDAGTQRNGDTIGPRPGHMQLRCRGRKRRARTGAARVFNREACVVMKSF